MARIGVDGDRALDRDALSILHHQADGAPVADADPADSIPATGGASSLPDGSAPGPEYTIKGNAGSMLFHPPSSPYYSRTKAEVWFRTPEEAREAGFTEYTPRRRASR